MSIGNHLTLPPSTGRRSRESIPCDGRRCEESTTGDGLIDGVTTPIVRVCALCPKRFAPAVQTSLDVTNQFRTSSDLLIVLRPAASFPRPRFILSCSVSATSQPLMPPSVVPRCNVFPVTSLEDCFRCFLMWILFVVTVSQFVSGCESPIDAVAKCYLSFVSSCNVVTVYRGAATASKFLL